MRRRETLTRALAALALVGLVAIPITAAAMTNPPEVGFRQSQMGQSGMMGQGAGGMMGQGAGGMMGQGAGGMMGQGAGGMMGGASGMMGGASGMMGGMASVRSEFDFLTQMIPHHEEAIESARVLLAGTQRPEMKAFAEEIIKTQSTQVIQMKDWLAAWYPGRDTTVAYQPMMRDLTGLTGDALDRAFLDDMIPHHMAAVMMSQQLVTRKLADHPEVVLFAEGIRDGQHAEIFQMAGWLQDWFGVNPMGAMMGASR